MSIIVDGYNYIGRSREFQLKDSTAAQKIIYLMGQYCGRIKKSLTLIFDGNYFVEHANRKRKYGRVTVIYTSPIYTADDAIKKMVAQQEYRRRKNLLIVSSDEHVLQFAKSHGAKVVRSEDFERTIYQTLFSKKDVDRVDAQLSPEEVEEWLSYFESKSSHATEHHVTPGKSQRKPTQITHASKPLGQQPCAETDISDLSGQHLSPKKSRKRKPVPQDSQEENIDRVNIHLSSGEVEQWMQIFGAADDEDDDCTV